MNTSGFYIKGTGSFETFELSTQDAVLKELDKGKQFWQCTVAGTFAEVQPYAYGSGRFWFYKGAEGNISYYKFINDTVVDAVNGLGYTFAIGSSENVLLFRESVILVATAAAYIENNTWYELEWDRTLDGEFTLRIIWLRLIRLSGLTRARLRSLLFSLNARSVIVVSGIG